jgi:hypothetical protein
MSAFPKISFNISPSSTYANICSQAAVECTIAEIEIDYIAGGKHVIRPDRRK